jgi:hypothetical protein
MLPVIARSPAVILRINPPEAGKLHDETISMEFYCVRDCFASPRLPSGGQVAMTSYAASIFRNRPTRGFIFSNTSSIKKLSPNGEMVGSGWIFEARRFSLMRIK